MRQNSGSESNKTRSLSRHHKGSLLVLLSLLSFSASSTAFAGAVFVGGPTDREGATSSRSQPAVEINSRGVKAMPYPMDRIVENIVPTRAVGSGNHSPMPSVQQVQYSAQGAAKPPMPTVSPRSIEQHTRTDSRLASAPRIDHLQLSPRDPNSLHITNSVGSAGASSDATLQLNGVWQDTINKNKARRAPPPDPVSYQVPAGWLSEGMRGLAAKAGYKTLVWTLDDSGRKDFRVHAPLALKGEEHLELLYELAKPYPVRLCLYATDKVAKVVMEGESCIIKGESQ